MNIMLSAKGSDITTWRAAESFATAYRQAAMERAISEHCSNSETHFYEICKNIDSQISENRKCLKQLDLFISNMSFSTTDNLKKLTADFYNLLYQHFVKFNSTHAFYQLSMKFLQQITALIIKQLTEKLTKSGHKIPPFSLIASGPTGRSEYSPYCQLQIMLVYSETSQTDTMNLFCNELHSEFEAAGIAIDPVVTPRNPLWMGTLSEWQQRCQDALQSEDNLDLINLCRLVDQFQLFCSDGFVADLKQISSYAIGTHSTAMSNLIERMTALSNGLNLLGRLKLEKNDTETPQFKLLEHGLLPFSAAVSALALIATIPMSGTCERINDLLKRGRLDVEMAEQMLLSWHTLHGLRLWREQFYTFEDITTEYSLRINPKEISTQQNQALVEALESVATLQRYVEIVFSGIKE